MRIAYRIFVGKPEENRQLERPRCSLEDNIKVYLKEIRCKGGELILLFQHKMY